MDDGPTPDDGGGNRASVPPRATAPERESAGGPSHETRAASDRTRVQSDDGTSVECTVSLPDELAGDLDDFCRKRYLHRDTAVRSLLADWLDSRSSE